MGNCKSKVYRTPGVVATTPAKSEAEPASSLPAVVEEDPGGVGTGGNSPTAASPPPAINDNKSKMNDRHQPKKEVKAAAEPASSPPAVAEEDPGCESPTAASPPPVINDNKSKMNDHHQPKKEVLLTISRDGQGLEQDDATHPQVDPQGLLPFSRDQEQDSTKKRVEEDTRLYNELLQSESEPVLPVEDIQGDCILGFNKRFTRRLVLGLKERNDPRLITLTKKWLKTFATTGITPPSGEGRRNSSRVLAKITSLKEVLEHRNMRKDLLARGRSISSDENLQNTVLCNICFSHNCLDALLSGTLYERTMIEFDSRDPFVIGATDRGTLLGDWEHRDKFEFGKDGNDDILINIECDSYKALDDATKTLKDSFEEFLVLVNDTEADRGIKGKDVFYSHEHFGFQDGLSQPEVRGTYYKKQENDVFEKEFIVRRNVKASDTDKRYLDYSRPGFRLLDTGHFILGQEYLEGISDDIDPIMSNPNPDVYRALKGAYPDWCTGGSFAVYRKIQQDVPLFWETCYDKAVSLANGEALSKEELKKKAGILGAKMIGRWWDGTPLEKEKPLSGVYYPPTAAESTQILDAKLTTDLDGLKNGFQFNNSEEAWTYRNGLQTTPYRADKTGSLCPFAGHIRKVNPRDEFTDIGSELQTLKHRLIRRGNNFGNRVNDVFNATDAEKKEPRGLSLVMYQSSIGDQFEFLQRHWANSTTRPHDGGDDMIIGLPPPNRSEKKITIPSSPEAVEIETMEVFSFPVGMGYFLLPPISAITDVIASKPVSDETIFYDVPADNKDFRDYQDLSLWDWTVRTVYWQSIWQSASRSTITNGGQTSVPGFSKYPTGIAYRLPNPKITAAKYERRIVDKKPVFPETNLQFRSTVDVQEMAKILGKVTKKDELLRAKISWQGFPKRLLDLYNNSETNPYEEAEKVGWPPNDLTYRTYAPVAAARQMDEYCEWFTHRNEDGKITQIDITCESPEYWTFLVKNRPDVALALYQKHISPKVTLASLLDEFGEYNLYNEWNTEKGAMHLNCPPNSLFAEIYIAAEAATRWGDCKNGTEECEPLTKGGDLIGCAKYGLSTRASDPTIGKNVNDLIRAGNIISISNPVGLYLEELDTSGWLKPDKVPFDKNEIKHVVKYVRESPDGKRKLRIQVKIPSEWHCPYVLGDCFIGGTPLDFAGQLVDASVTVFLDAIAVNGVNEKMPFLTKDVDKAIVPCKDLWGTKDKVGKVLGPQQNLVNPMLDAPEPVAEQNIKWTPATMAARY